MNPKPLVAAVTALALCSISLTRASDHGDAPQSEGVTRQDANLTDLHAFVVESNLVIALCSNPAIPRTATNYIFPSDVSFEINIDIDCAVNPADPMGMGGTIVDSNQIAQDRVLRVKFRKDGTPFLQLRRGLGPARENIRLFAGLRDDPFIRGPRIGRNVAAIVVELPLAIVTPMQSTILIWATSKVDDFNNPFQDLAGRSLRSMMPENSRMNIIQPAHQYRELGVQPDVMIFDTARPAAFPNGRALTDDVVDLVGDPRVLGNDAPFPSANDRPFLTEFPYLPPPQ